MKEYTAMLRRIHQTDPVMLWGFGVAAAIFVFTVLNLATRSLWWDELFTLALASPDTPDADAITQMRRDVHPPLYWFAVRLWMQLWQTSSDVAARAFNLVPYGFAVWMAANALRQRDSRQIGLWLVLTFTAFGVYWYLQEARMYATMIAQALCGCLIVIGFEQRRLKPITPAYVAILVVTFVVMPLGHWFSLGFAGCLLIGLSLWALVERRVQFVVLFVSLGVILGALGGWWILTNTDATVGALDNYGQWVYDGKLSLYGLKRATIGVLLFTLTLNPVLIAAAGLGLWLIIRRPRQNIGPIVILGACLVVGGTILAASLFVAMYQVRNFMWLVAPLALFAATGLQFVFAKLNLTRVRQAAATIAVLAISLAIAPFAPRLTQLEVDQWRSAGRFIASTPGCEEADVHVYAFWLDHSPTPFHYRYSQRIAGHYLDHPERIKSVLRDETLPIGTGADSACPVVLWVPEHESRALEVGRQVLGPGADGLERQAFVGHTIFLRPQSKQVAGK